MSAGGKSLTVYWLDSKLAIMSKMLISLAKATTFNFPGSSLCHTFHTYTPPTVAASSL